MRHLFNNFSVFIEQCKNEERLGHEQRLGHYFLQIYSDKKKCEFHIILSQLQILVHFISIYF